MWVALSGGCGAARAREVCVGLDDPDSLWPHAQLVRIAAFGDGVACDGAAVLPRDAAPLAARLATPADAFALDAPADVSAVTVTLYSDVAGERAIGGACGAAVPERSECMALRLVRGKNVCFEAAEALASAACARFTGDAGECTAFTCADGGEAVCSTGAAVCACWVYAGSGAGRVRVSFAGSCRCNGGMQWN
jgi:hypothetical protein